MRLFRWIRPFGLLVAFSAALTATGSAAPATQITGIRVETEPNGNPAVVIQFNGQPPQITPVGNGTSQVTLLIPNVVPGPLVPPLTTGSGGIQSVAITQSAGSTSVFIRLSTPQSIRYRATGNVAILDLPAQNPGNFLLPGAAAASNTPPPAGLQTVVIPLKYADISEIAGVLVQGSNIASNDNFNPVQTNIGTSQLNGSFGGVTGGFQGGGTTQQSFGGGSVFGGGANGNGLAQRLNDSIAVDRRLNAIILTGTPETIEAYRSTIEKLDVALPSVILETEIVELDENAARRTSASIIRPAVPAIVVSGAPSSSSTTAGGVQNGLTIATGSKPLGLDFACRELVRASHRKVTARLSPSRASLRRVANKPRS